MTSGLMGNGSKPRLNQVRLTAIRHPIAERGLNQRQRRHAGSVSAQDPGSQGEPEDDRLPQQQRALLLGETAFRADQHIDPVQCRLRPLKRLQGIGDIGGLVAEHQQPPGFALVQIALERNGLGDLGQMTPDEDECVAVPDPDTLSVLPWDRRFAFMALAFIAVR